jgi:hypothetical protein
VISDVGHDVNFQRRDKGEVEVLFFHLDIEREGFGV